MSVCVLVFLQFLIQYRQLKRSIMYFRFDTRTFSDRVSLNVPTINFIKYRESDNVLPAVETAKEGKKMKVI